MAQNQKGNTVVGIIIGLGVGLLLACIYFMVFNPTAVNQASSGAKNIASLTPAATQSVLPTMQHSVIDATQSWIKITSPQAKFSLKYPKSWKYFNGKNNGGAETISFTSSQGFTIEIVSFSEESEYAKQTTARVPNFLNENCGCTINFQEELFVSGYGKLLLAQYQQGVQGGFENTLSLITTDKGTLIKSPKVPQTYTSFWASAQGGEREKRNTITPKEFDNMPDVQTAKDILKTISY